VEDGTMIAETIVEAVEAMGMYTGTYRHTLKYGMMEQLKDGKMVQLKFRMMEKP
jgi:hypothetical protein